MRFKRSLLVLNIGILASIAIYSTDILPWKIAFNRTPSLPQGLYLTTNNVAEVNRGDLVCTHYQEPAWAVGRYLPPGAQLCKEVLGLAGDTLEERSGELFLLNKEASLSLGIILSKDSNDRPLPHLNWQKQAIPAGKVYLGSTRIARSLDSRYLGLINQTDIHLKIYPLLTY